MKLSELNPRLHPWQGEAITQKLTFLCPRCKRHEIGIDIWARAAGVVEPIGRVWHAEPENSPFDALSVSPSIDRSGMDACGGWHGFITNGDVQ